MFQEVVKDAIRQVDRWLDLPPDETDWLQVSEDCRVLLAEIEQKALMAGLSDAVAACQVVSTTVSVQQTRQALAKCLAASFYEHEPAKIEAVLLTVRQAAERYNLGERTLYRLLQQGDLQNYGAGASKRVKPADLEQYLEREVQPVAARPSLFD